MLLHLVRKHDFGPDELHELSVAYDNVCAAVEDESPAVRTYLAEQIIEMAFDGETASTELYLKCLERYRNVTSMKQAS